MWFYIFFIIIIILHFKHFKVHVILFWRWQSERVALYVHRNEMQLEMENVAYVTSEVWGNRLGQTD